MVKDNRNNEQIYGRNDMIMLDQNNKIYGSLGLADGYVMKTEEGTRLMLSNPKLGSFDDVLTEFNIYGMSEQESTTGANLIDVDSMLNECLVKNDDGTYSILKTETGRFSESFPVNLKAGTKIRFDADVIEYNGVYPLKLQIVLDKQTISVGKSILLNKDIRELNIYQDNQNDVGTYTKFKNAILSIGEERIPYEPYTGGKPSPSPDYPQEIKSVVNPTVKVTNEDGLKVQSLTLNNITLNAISVSSGGNVTINGQQYIADYVDVKRGKFVRMCKYKKLLSKDIEFVTSDKKMYVVTDEIWDVEGNYTSRVFGMFCSIGIAIFATAQDMGWNGKGKIVIKNVQFINIDEAKNYFDNNDVYVCYPIPMPEEIPITMEEVSAFKQLLTYYPVTIIENNYNTWMKATYKSTESV